MSPRPDVSAQRMPQILDAAAAVFGAKGLGDATVADIAEAAGLSKALVFKYFRSKDELVLALLRNLFEAFPGPERAKGASCRTALLDWCHRSALAIEGNAVFAAIAAELLATASRDAGMRDIVRTAYSGVLEQVTALIAEGVLEGEFVTEDAHGAALAVIAQMEGANLLYLIDPAGFSLRDAYLRGVALLLDGITRPAR